MYLVPSGNSLQFAPILNWAIHAYETNFQAIVESTAVNGQ